MSLTIRPMTSAELMRLTALFDYNDVPAMIAENAAMIDSGEGDIFLLLEDDELLGELHVRWCGGDDPLATGPHWAYLYAYRIRHDRQGEGLGQQLMRSVIAQAQARGCTELTIGVEDDNALARHIYAKFGFVHHLARRSESYQGDSYEYDLYLRRV